MCSITLTMSTSEMVSRLSTWTSTPTGIGGPEGKWHHIRNALVLTLFFSKQKVKMTYYKQKVLKKNECTKRNRQGHGLFFLPAYGCDSTHHHFFLLQKRSFWQEPWSHTHRAAAHDMMVTVWLRFLLLTYFSLCTLHHHDHPPPAHRYNQVIITAQSGSGGE